ncbi:MAG: DNA translocase FtsK 4TM domain-containing protein, partial [Acidobacteriota bacterium]
MARDQVVRRKSAGTPGSNQSRKLFNEIAGLVFFGLGIVFLLALISYDPTDPSWNASGPQTKAHNWIGPVGALLGDGLYQALGYAALIVPFALFALAWWRLIDPRPSFSGLKGFGLGLLGFALTGLLSLAEGCANGSSFRHSFHSGGWLGHLLVCDSDYGLTRFLNIPGSAIVLSVIFLSGLILATPFSLVALLMRLSPREQEAGVLRTLSERFRSWRQMREIERERRNVEAEKARRNEHEDERERARERAREAARSGASARSSGATSIEVRTSRTPEIGPDLDLDKEPDEIAPPVKVVRKSKLTTLGLSELFEPEKPAVSTPADTKVVTSPDPVIVATPAPQVAASVGLELDGTPAVASDLTGINATPSPRRTGELRIEEKAAEKLAAIRTITTPYTTVPLRDEIDARFGKKNGDSEEVDLAPVPEQPKGVESVHAAANGASQSLNGRTVTGRIASKLAERFKNRDLAAAEAGAAVPDRATSETPAGPEGSSAETAGARNAASLPRRLGTETSERRRISPERIVGVPVNRSIAELKQPVEARANSLVKHLLRQEHKRPTTEMLTASDGRSEMADNELRDRAQQLTDKCQEFSVAGVVTQISPGPVVTTFEFKLDPGVKYGRVTSLVDDLCLGLKAESIRIDRIPGKSTVGIEIPNRKREIIRLREVIESQRFRDSQGRLTLALGKTIDGSNYVADLAKMPHLLIAGATGAGKSVALNTILVSLLFKSSPDEVKLILIDPKRLELGLYSDLPHLLTPIV